MEEALRLVLGRADHGQLRGRDSREGLRATRSEERARLGPQDDGWVYEPGVVGCHGDLVIEDFSVGRRIGIRLVDALFPLYLARRGGVDDGVAQEIFHGVPPPRVHVDQGRVEALLVPRVRGGGEFPGGVVSVGSLGGEERDEVLARGAAAVPPARRPRVPLPAALLGVVAQNPLVEPAVDHEDVDVNSAEAAKEALNLGVVRGRGIPVELLAGQEHVPPPVPGPSQLPPYHGGTRAVEAARQHPVQGVVDERFIPPIQLEIAVTGETVLVHLSLQCFLYGGRPRLVRPHVEDDPTSSPSWSRGVAGAARRETRADASARGEGRGARARGAQQRGRGEEQADPDDGREAPPRETRAFPSSRKTVDFGDGLG